MKSRSFKKSLRDTLRENQRGLDHYALMYGKPQTQHIAVKPKREIVNHSPAEELEGAVISECIDVLMVHPRVLFAVRQNSGAAYYERRDKHGNPIEVPVWYHRIIRSREDMRLADTWGLTTDFLLFAFEAKRRNWTHPTDQREREQKAFLDMVNACGGIGRFVTCAEDVIEALKVVNPAQQVVNP